MITQDYLDSLWFCLALLGIPCLLWLASLLFSRNREMSGPATVKSHQAAPHQSYKVTFTLSDGEDLELYTILSDYQLLKDGTSGFLTWQGRTFLDFEPND